MNPPLTLRFSGKAALTAATAVLLVVCACSSEQDEPAVTEAPPPTRPSPEELQRFDDLTIRVIMQGAGLIGTAPEDLRFSADGSRIFFEWNDPAALDSLNALSPESAYKNYLDLEKRSGTFVMDVASREFEKLSDAAADTLAPDEYAWNKERTRRAEIRGEDLYLVDLSAGTTRQITATEATEHSVAISVDGRTTYFVRDDNLFSVPWRGHPVRQLTDLRLSNDPDDDEPSKQREILIEQQKELFKDFQREDEPPKKRPRPVYVGKDRSIDEFRVSPTGRYAALELSSDPSGVRRPEVPIFITESGYMETQETRPKVGDEGQEIQVVLVDLEGDSLLTLDVESSEWLSIRSWSPVSDVLLVRGINADFTTRNFYGIFPDNRDAEGKIEPLVLDEYKDAAWVGGPNFYSTGEWLRDGSGIYFVSEEAGYSHLFTVSMDGSRREQLTTGQWEVRSAHPSLDGTRWYLITNEIDPGARRLWVMDRDGANRRLLTADSGEYVPTYSPDESVIAVLKSTVISPREVFLLDTATEALEGPLTVSTSESFRSFPWVWPEVINIKASDGKSFRAHILRPETFDQKSNGAGVIFIHGAGYTQNVIDWWPYYYREYMFNHFLALNGYTVLNVDFRASAGYGRECRVAIHKHMGGRDLDDVIDGARHLVKYEGVHEEKVGVYGGSYGGFLTLMALFKYPDEITCGGAIRSVTDWAHYNHWYTSRILGTPESDPDAYRRSSPIYFADGFEGGLLMLHGLADANVLAADVMRLTQRLIELGKEDWELAIYPIEPHSFVRADSWTDEYKRIFKLFEENLANPNQAAGVLRKQDTRGRSSD